MRQLLTFICIIFLTGVVFLSCGSKKEKKINSREMVNNYYDPNGELDSAEQIIMNLPMVKELRYIPTIMAVRLTTDINDSIHYQVGARTNDGFVPEFNFYYYRKTKQIKYLDTSTDSLLLIQ